MSIQSIERAIAVLNLFRDNRDQLSLAEIATAMGLAKTTVHTIIQTLAQNGFLHQDLSSRKYSLGFALFELGVRQAGNLAINRNAINPMHQLTNDTGCYCRLGVWDAGTVFVTMTVYPQGKDAHPGQLGPRLPGYCTALGKAMLAHMPERMVIDYLESTDLIAYTEHTITDRVLLLEDLKQAQRRGYAVSQREILLHQVGIGAPVFDKGGNVAGAASIQLNPEEIDAERIQKTASRLLRATYQISSDLGYQPISVQRR